MTSKNKELSNLIARWRPENHHKIVSLLAEGANWSAKNEAGLPIFWRLILSNQTLLLSLLQQQPELLDVRHRDGSSLIDFIIKLDRPVSTELIDGISSRLTTDEQRSSAYADDLKNWVSHFLHKGRYAAAEVLLRHGVAEPKPHREGAPFNKTSEYFSHLARHPHDLYLAYRKNNLLVSEQDERGQQLLHHAFQCCADRDARIVSNFLLQLPQQSLEVIDADGQTPLHVLAMKSYNLEKYSELILREQVAPALLQEKSFDFKLLDNEGMSFLHILALSEDDSHLESFLHHSHGYTVNVLTEEVAISEDTKPNTAFFYKRESVWYCKITYLDNHSTTIYFDSEEPINELLNSIAASRSSFHDTYELLASDIAALISIVFKYNQQTMIDVDVLSTPDGQSPLHMAIDRLRIYNARALVAYDANPFLPDAQGRSPATLINQRIKDVFDEVRNFDRGHDILKSLKNLRTIMTYEHGEKAMRHGDLDTAIVAFSAVTHDDENYTNANIMLAEAYSIQYDKKREDIEFIKDSNQKSEELNKLELQFYYTVLPVYLIAAKREDPIAKTRLRRTTIKYFKLTEDATERDINECISIFVIRINTVKKLQKTMRKVSDNATLEQQCHDDYEALHHAVCNTEKNKVTSAQKIRLIQLAKQIIRKAVKIDFGLMESLVVNLITRNYSTDSDFFYKSDTTLITLLDELAEAGSTMVHLHYYNYYLKNDAEQLETVSITKFTQHVNALIEQQYFNEAMKSMFVYQRDFSIELEVTITEEFKCYLQEKEKRLATSPHNHEQHLWLQSLLGLSETAGIKIPESGGTPFWSLPNRAGNLQLAAIPEDQAVNMNPKSTAFH